MTPIQRAKSIEYFMTNPDVEVFLVFLKAGGVALNLTEASRVFIVDPWWNPAAEWQSADRCHRIGQKRPCVITRLCIEDSVESRMVMLQEKKANMINGTINNDKTAWRSSRRRTCRLLFRGGREDGWWFARGRYFWRLYCWRGAGYDYDWLYYDDWSMEILGECLLEVLLARKSPEYCGCCD